MLVMSVRLLAVADITNKMLFKACKIGVSVMTINDEGNACTGTSMQDSTMSGSELQMQLSCMLGLIQIPGGNKVQQVPYCGSVASIEHCSCDAE